MEQEPEIDQILEKLDKETLDRCMGCIVGALVGDASGAVLEFVHGINEKMVDKALTMPGGGVFEVAPGQITDDGELTMAVLAGLAKCHKGYDPDTVCVEYGRWINSHPFDIGNTTRNSLMHASIMKGKLSGRLTEAALKMAHSVSNGSTMKLSPTAVWCSFIDDDEALKQLVTTETNHMHHHRDVVATNIAITLALRDLIRGKSPQEAYQTQKDYAVKTSIEEWITGVESGNMQACNRSIGWVKIAYQRAMHHLKQGTAYRDALKDVLLQGGDTDTNACILGMVLGARDGFSKLPEDMVKATLTCTTSKAKHPRPPFIVPANSFEKNFKLMMSNCIKLFKK